MKELFLVNRDYTEMIKLSQIVKYELDLTTDQLQSTSVDLSLDLILTLLDEELYFSEQIVSIVINQEEYDDECQELMLEIRKRLSQQLNNLLIKTYQQSQEHDITDAEFQFVLPVEDYISLEKAVIKSHHLLTTTSTIHPLPNQESNKKKGFKFFN